MPGKQPGRRRPPGRSDPALGPVPGGISGAAVDRRSDYRMDIGPMHLPLSAGPFPCLFPTAITIVSRGSALHQTVTVFIDKNVAVALARESAPLLAVTTAAASLAFYQTHFTRRSMPANSASAVPPNERFGDHPPLQAAREYGQITFLSVLDVGNIRFQESLNVRCQFDHLDTHRLAGRISNHQIPPAGEVIFDHYPGDVRCNPATRVRCIN